MMSQAWQEMNPQASIVSVHGSTWSSCSPVFIKVELTSTAIIVNLPVKSNFYIYRWKNRHSRLLLADMYLQLVLCVAKNLCICPSHVFIHLLATRPRQGAHLQS